MNAAHSDRLSAVAALDGLTSDQRYQLGRVESRPRFLGSAGIPRVTARALLRRGLIEPQSPTSTLLQITELGRAVQAERRRRADTP